jgi:hypothetical protein
MDNSIHSHALPKPGPFQVSSWHGTLFKTYPIIKKKEMANLNPNPITNLNINPTKNDTCLILCFYFKQM